MSEAARAWVDPFGPYLKFCGDSSYEPMSYSDRAAYAAAKDGTTSGAASVFGFKDVQDLVRVVTTPSLGVSVRCAAAEQLCICASDPRLEESLAAPSTLAALARLAAAGCQAAGDDTHVGCAALKAGRCNLKASKLC